MDLLLLTQYFDMLRDVGQSSRAATVFLPHAPQSVASLQGAMRDGFMQVRPCARVIARARVGMLRIRLTEAHPHHCTGVCLA